MVIKSSLSADVAALLRDLTGADEDRREAALARFALLGPRAVDRLIAAYDTTSKRDARIAILRALEPSVDRRSLKIARRALDEGSDVAVTAVSVLYALRRSADRGTAAEALDVLVACVLEPSAQRRVRAAALESLNDMPAAFRSKLDAALRDEDPSGLGLAAATRPTEIDVLWADALDGRLPDRPGPLREAVALKAQSAPLPSLQKLVDRLKIRERETTADAERAEWRMVRGAVHQTLALRGSRLALYDLRETLDEARGSLPATFLAALQVLGDSSCLESLAGAYCRMPRSDIRERHQVASTFKAILRRERLTRRHPVVRRIAARWPAEAADLTGGANPSARTPLRDEPKKPARPNS